MNAATRLAAYAGALALVFGAAWGAGVITGFPLPAPPAPAASSVPDKGHDMAGMDGMEGMEGMDMSGDAGDDSSPDVGTDGLASSAQGWTFTPAVTTFAPGVPADLAFTVVDEAGRRVTAFPAAPQLAVVRRDGVGLQWLNPVVAQDGSWHAALSLPAPGVYRAFVDLGGPVLGADLFAPGAFTPAPTGPSRTADVDGFQVRLDGDLLPHQPSQVFATVSRGGAPVTDLEPDGPGFGRLITLRAGDLAYGVAHPGDGSATPPAPGDRSGPAVAFTTVVPSAGSYWVFLRFRQGGVAHTAAFSVATRSLPG